MKGIRCGRRGCWCFMSGVESDLGAGEEEPAVRGDEGVGAVHGHVAAPAQQRAVLHAEEVGVGLLQQSRGVLVIVSQWQEKTETEKRMSCFGIGTWHMSQLGAAAGGWIFRRWCLPASRLAACTSRSQRAHRAASSAQQSTQASAASHAEHSTFIAST